MQILPLNFNINQYSYNKNKTNSQKQNNITIPHQLAFESRVDKRIIRFEPYHEQKKRLPRTLKEYLGTLEDKFSVMPPEAMKKAYEALNIAETIKDIQKLFPNEELFLYLTSLKDSVSKRGIIGIYKDYFEDIYRNGILKNGEDFTVYVLKKIFAEAKTTYREINDDLDNDLIPAVKDMFRIRYGHNKYVTTEILQALEIYPPDQHFRNSLKFTQEGYSDIFGLIISKSLLDRLKNMSEEQKAEEIQKRAEGMERWWNDMSYEEKLELAVGVDSQEEVYKNYRKYANENRRQNRIFLESFPEYEPPKPKQKVKTGMKLNDKEVFILWMQNNLAKYYDNLSEVEKTVIEIRRSKRQTKIWKDLTPEKKTELINKIRTGAEPQRYAMYDAWNRSLPLIRVLSEFLTEKYAKVKPDDLIYGKGDFKEFQSKIMTEFWELHRDLAQDFGGKLSYSHTRVEDAIKNGEFEELKKEIEAKRDERKKLFEQEKAERKKSVISNAKDKTTEEINELKKEFFTEYAKNNNPKNILPNSYITDMSEIIFETFPAETIKEYLLNPSSKNMFTTEVLLQKCSKENLKKLKRIQHALEATITKTLTKTGEDSDIFRMQTEELISVLEKRVSDINLPFEKQLYNKRIQIYDYYKQDLEPDKLDYIMEGYFESGSPNEITAKRKEVLKDYINEYGQTALIMFPVSNTTIPNAMRESFYDKFLTLMPQEVKDAVKPFIKKKEDILKEYQIATIRGQITERFEFVPLEVLDLYTRFIAGIIRTADKDPNISLQEKYNYSIKNIREKLAKKHIKHDGNVTIFRMPKYTITDTNTKFKLLAAEQAMADELTRVTKKTEMVYGYEFEALAIWTEMVRSLIKKQGSCNFAVPFNNGYGAIYIAKEKATSDNIKRNYQKYINNIYSNLSNVLDKDGTINKEELLYCLNPQENKPERDSLIMNKINIYFPEQKQEIIQEKTEAAISDTKTKEKTTSETNELRKDFRFEYARRTNPSHILPSNYVKEMADIILATFPKPKEAMEEYFINPSVMFSNEVLYQKCSEENLKKLKRIQHALATAIAAELAAKTGDYSLYGESVDTLIEKLKEQELGFGRKKRNNIDTENIQQLYNYYKRDLSKGDILYITNNFFLTDHPSTKEEDKLIMDYIDEYGKSAEILFSVNISLPLNAKEAFNNKFLNLMPAETRNVATPMIKTKEDLKANYDIEIVRRQLAKRFDSVIPQEPLNIYTREVAKMMRMMNRPDADPELKELYGIEAFKKSISHKEDEINGNIASVLKLPKYYIAINSSKLYMLAIEQAMADELYRVSKNNIVYKYELEDLVLWYELSSLIKKGNKNDFSLSDPDSGEGFVIKEKPNKANIMQKYVRYLKEFEASEDLFLENGDLNREEILYCLNPDNNKPEKDKYIKERINGYFAD